MYAYRASNTFVTDMSIDGFFVERFSQAALYSVCLYGVQDLCMMALAGFVANFV